jgi:hypothetical protein
VVSALLGAVAGFGAGALLAREDPSHVSKVNEPAAQPSERMRSLRPSEERSAAPARALEQEDAGAPTASVPTDGKPSQAEADKRAAKLLALRAQARAANEQLAAARKRIGKLERELAKEALPGEARNRHPFDFTPDDWREMAGKDMIKDGK